MENELLKHTSSATVLKVIKSDRTVQNVELSNFSYNIGIFIFITFLNGLNLRAGSWRAGSWRVSGSHLSATIRTNLTWC